MSDAGYLHADYAASFSAVATPTLLPRSGGWLLEREVPGSGSRDAVGCYPLFCCRRWHELPHDFDGLRSRLVTLTLVTDPFGSFDRADLGSSFDFVREYKHHFVADLSRVDELPSTRNHRRNLARARASVEVLVAADPKTELGQVVPLYEALVERRGISGLRRFTTAQVAQQLAVPGAFLFTASLDGETLAFLLCYLMADVAYAHLAGASERGYELRASFALYYAALHHFRGDASWFVLGSTPDIESASLRGGLALFKRGFATDTRPSFLCGSVFDRPTYRRLGGSDTAAYFPAYRAGEAAVA